MCRKSIIIQSVCRRSFVQPAVFGDMYEVVHALRHLYAKALHTVLGIDPGLYDAMRRH